MAIFPFVEKAVAQAALRAAACPPLYGYIRDLDAIVSYGRKRP
jgi:hypothetical protein